MGEGTEKMVELLSKLLGAQEMTAGELSKISAELSRLLVVQQNMALEMKAGFQAVSKDVRDLNTRLDILANWRGGEVISMRDRLEKLEHEVEILKKRGA
ncbi:MAG: hypothetical protein HY791_13880 [Deltaproteobacteria bacterium]|nr:hypothetical protein [Deltaproteobacteria bacterium]